MSSASEIRFRIKPPSRLSQPLGKDLLLRPRSEIVLDTSGITFPMAALRSHEFDEPIEGMEPPPERTIRWADIGRLQKGRDHYGNFEYVFGEGNAVYVEEEELENASAFQEAVERLSGKRFEKTFPDMPPVIDDSAGSPPATFEMPIPTDAQKFPIFPVPRLSSQLLGFLGCATRVAIVLALLTGVGFLFPDQVTRFLDLPFGFVGIMLILLAAIAMPWLWRRRRAEQYFLAVASEGLYARVPSRTFPRFTPWSAVKDFTMPPERRLKGRSKGLHGFTLYTTAGAYGLGRCSIPNEFTLFRALFGKLDGVTR